MKAGLRLAPHTERIFLKLLTADFCAKQRKSLKQLNNYLSNEIVPITLQKRGIRLTLIPLFIYLLTTSVSNGFKSSLSLPMPSITLNIAFGKLIEHGSDELLKKNIKSS